MTSELRATAAIDMKLSPDRRYNLHQYWIRYNILIELHQTFTT